MLYSLEFYITLLQNYIKRLLYNTWMDPKLGLIMQSLIILHIENRNDYLWANFRGLLKRYIHIYKVIISNSLY